jgi:drug/metabolite transporter (DMT)-like permease
VVFGSLVGFTAYIWLLGVSTPARVSTYAYVNPVVAVFLGWAMAGEAVTARVLIAAAVIVAAVAVITTGPRPRAEPGALAEAAGSPGASRRRRQAA